jgi:zinc protease
MMRRSYFALALAVVAACGPKPPPEPPVPVLPGDGDSNVAKPPPLPPKAEVDDPWAGKTDLVAVPPAAAPAKLDLPTIDHWKLGNGLDVFVVENKRLPIASMQLAVKVGRYAEPRARLGVAEATADMLVKGTKKHDASGLARAIDNVGGTISADSTFEATLLSCNVLARDLRACFDLVPEMVTQPSFAEDELKKIKDRMRQEVLQRLDDNGALASNNAQNLLWGGEHVRGWINSVASVSLLSRDDLVAWHKAWYAPNNALLVIAGDVDAKKLKPEIERAFGSWRKSAVPPTPSYREGGLSGTRIRIVDKPGATQTQIRIAQYGIRHDDARFFDALIWNHALAARLGKLGRAGKAFAATSSFDRNLDRGSFVASAVARNAHALVATKLVLDEIAKMQKEGPSDDELHAAVASLGGAYALRFQSAADVGSAIVGADLHGFGINYLSTYGLAVGKVTVESAKTAAAEILDPKNYVVVMVGDAKDLEPQLKKEGWRYELRSFGEPLTPTVEAPPPTVDAKQAAAARKVIDDALAAKGGKAKLAAVKAWRSVASGQAPISGTMLPVDVEKLVVAPDKMRIDATINVPAQGSRPAQHLKVVVGLDGSSGWNTDPTGATKTLDAQERAAIAFELWRDPETVLLTAAAPNARLVPRADETVDGAACSVVEIVSPFNDIGVQLFVDKKTKLVVRMSYAEGGQREVDDFADWKDVKGVKVAMKRTTSHGGQSTTLQISSFEIDPQVPAKAFAKP